MFYVHDISTFNLIQTWEFIVAPAYLILIFIYALFIKHKFYRNSPIRKYLIPGLILKLIGAMGVCLIYNYYYKGGDTCNYFRESKIIAAVFYESPIDAIRILFSSSGQLAGDLLKYMYYVEFANADNSFMILKIAAIIQLFGFHSFLLTSILFGFISFWSIWKIFRLFSDYYPALSNQFAIAFLFVPSVFFWGSGILKDTVCISCLSLFFCSIDSIFFKRKNIITNSLIVIVTGYILIIVKVYIIMSFTICLTLLILLKYRSNIKSKSLRTFLTPIVVFIALVIGISLIKFLSETSLSDKYSVDKISETSALTRDYIAAQGGGSTYTLGEVDNSIWGMIKLVPAGINVTLFRPYLWESHNAIALIAALESLAILLLTLKVMYTTGLRNFFKTLSSNNLVIFCISFSMLFAYAVGISSYNFGTLVRYKIPCIPFYIVGIQLIQYHFQKSIAPIKFRKKKKRVLIEA